MSDNSEHSIVHGGDGKPTTETPVAGASKTAPFPEGVTEESHDEPHSGGGSRGMPATGSGKGGHEPKHGVDVKGLGAGGGPKGLAEGNVLADLAKEVK